MTKLCIAPSSALRERRLQLPGSDRRRRARLQGLLLAVQGAVLEASFA